MKVARNGSELLIYSKQQCMASVRLKVAAIG